MDGFWANEEFRIYLETDLDRKRKEMHCCVLWTSDSYVEAGYPAIDSRFALNEREADTLMSFVFENGLQPQGASQAWYSNSGHNLVM
jgi:hypothetical protein